MKTVTARKYWECGVNENVVMIVKTKRNDKESLLLTHKKAMQQLSLDLFICMMTSS